MSGSILRTNYRITGGQTGITAVGRPLASLASGVGGSGIGRALAGPGFMWFSMALASGFQSQSLDTAAGWSGRFGDSTFGTMSLFYGDAFVSSEFDSGYTFIPIGIHTLSYSTVAASELGSVPIFRLCGIQISNSIWGVSAVCVSVPQTGGAYGSVTVAAGKPARLLVWGFIASAP